ncbi:Sfi1-domain-containing protein [Parathielavia hyrcaniae]|uniref:Sfi1-domain-containing protein n=1 Tax=Parathielavia hyrcaniae TaxID=113614 RepID=A0AAN6T2N3_9PEZI|nr:Sfi1-domain-containing protein [Parathielavia hyrcaniae]
MQHQPSSHYRHGRLDQSVSPPQPGDPALDADSTTASSAFHYISGRHESYSDQDVELVHEIVILGESLYPALPERERLPTNALFLAAEEVLPRYGYDPEDTPSHIARLIFKIGGQRSGDTLSDKFKAVLGGLGIQLEFVPSSPPARPDSRASFALSSTHTSDYSVAQPTFCPRREPEDKAVAARDRGISRPESPPRSPSAPPQALLQPDAAAPVVVVEVDTEELEAKFQHVRMQEERELVKEALGVWRAVACQTKRMSDELRSVAVEYDNHDLLGEVLDIWNEEAAAAERLRRQAEEAARHEAYIAKMERRATRVYEIFTIRTVLAEWQEQAREEIDRTAVARRHIVRKRAFEGWHAQHVEDETKVRNFILGNALHVWSQVALHHEVRHGVAAQWHHQQLCRDVLLTMWRESKERLADETYAVGLATQCLVTWADKASEAQEEYQVAVALDERLVLDEAVNIWLEEVDAQQYHAYDCTRQWLIQGCRRDLDYWQDQAKLSALLKQHNAKQEQETKRRALATWLNAFQDLKHNTAVADGFLLKEPVDHWEREMKLKLFIERDEYETKAAVLERWALEEKLAWYEGHLETRTKRQTLNALLTAARRVSSERQRHEQEADYVDSYYTQAEVVDTWLAETDQIWKHRHNANIVNLYRTTRPCIDQWRERCHQSQARDGYYRRRADGHRARSIVCGVLDEWPAVAQTARRERMMASLRQFRRQYKVELAQDCLGRWLDATADALDAHHDARQTNLHYKREDLNDCLALWNRAAKRSDSIQRIAVDAELEVYCGRWQAQFQDAKENTQDAVEYDGEQTRKRCWDAWEHQMLQNEGKRHLAATLQEKNERRVRRRVLTDWHQNAVPHAAARYNFNPRMSSSLAARRSVRQQLARSTAGASTAAGGGGGGGGGRGGFYTASQLAVLRRPRHETTTTTTTPSRLAAASESQLQLGPMPEFDEDPLVPDPDDPGFMSTPTRWTGSTRTMGGLYGRGVAAAASMTPSAILPSPYERELRRQYAGPNQRVVGFADIYEESAEGLYE